MLFASACMHLSARKVCMLGTAKGLKELAQFPPSLVSAGWLTHRRCLHNAERQRWPQIEYLHFGRYCILTAAVTVCARAAVAGFHHTP